ELQIPTQVWGGPQHGQVVWKAPTLSALVRLLHNPTYAGVYVYGQCAYDPFARSAATGNAKTQLRPLEEWPVGLHAGLPAPRARTRSRWAGGRTGGTSGRQPANGGRCNPSTQTARCK